MRQTTQLLVASTCNRSKGQSSWALESEPPTLRLHAGPLADRSIVTLQRTCQSQSMA